MNIKVVLNCKPAACAHENRAWTELLLATNPKQHHCVGVTWSYRGAGIAIWDKSLEHSHTDSRTPKASQDLSLKSYFVCPKRFQESESTFFSMG